MRSEGLTRDPTPHISVLVLLVITPDRTAPARNQRPRVLRHPVPRCLSPDEPYCILPIMAG